MLFLCMFHFGNTWRHFDVGKKQRRKKRKYFLLATSNNILKCPKCTVVLFYVWRWLHTVMILKLSIFSMLFNPFPHTTILQQTTLNVFCQNIDNLHNWMDNLWQKVENIVAKGEIARSVQVLLLLLCFQKAVCCRGVRKRLYEGKG